MCNLKTKYKLDEINDSYGIDNNYDSLRDEKFVKDQNSYASDRLMFRLFKMIETYFSFIICAVVVLIILYVFLVYPMSQDKSYMVALEEMFRRFASHVAVIFITLFFSHYKSSKL